MRISRWMAAVVLVLTGVGVEARAQVIGTFTWQTQPFCNRVTVTITQQGGVYQLTGADDQCGAFSAPVYGTAVATATGINMGFSAAFGTGRTSHLTAIVSLATVSGTWADGDGNAGTFAFNGAATGGSVRPGPPAFPSLATIPSGVTVTGELDYDASAANAASDVVMIALPGIAPAPLSVQTVNFAPGSGAGDIDPTCTGSVVAPTAPRGKVCIYASSFQGVKVSTVSGEAARVLRNRAFIVYFEPSAAGADVYFTITWAYTAP